MLVLTGAALLAADPHRPAYHFLPSANWMNDTMGIFWNGKYHIFYLYNPDGPVWRQAKEWGHAESTDLVHWKILPSALGPVAGGPENLCCQTGSLTIHNGTPTAVYTCAPGICVATSDDDLRTWRRDPKNPVIAGPPAGMDVFGFRDPFVFQCEKDWCLLQGSGVKGGGGVVLLYTSADLRSWRYIGPLLPEPAEGDEVWEVPNLFHLGGKDIVTYSPTKESRFTRYLLGSFRGKQFVPETHGKMDLGGYFYAATSFQDEGHRRIMIAWIKEGRSKDALQKAGWSGILSLPRQLSMGSDGEIRVEPVTEVETLRRRHKRYTNLRVAPGTGKQLDVRGDTLDIVAEIETRDAVRVGLKVRYSPFGEEETKVYLDRNTSQFLMDITRSSADPQADKKVLGEPAKLGPVDRVRIRVLVDRSVVEAFLNSRVAIAGRIYPTLSASVGIQVFAEGGVARLTSLDVWEMGSIW